MPSTSSLLHRRYKPRFSHRDPNQRQSSKLRLELRAEMSNSCLLQEFKVVIVGDHRVGKTSLLRCWKGDLFEPFSKATIGFDLCTGDYHFSEGSAKIQVWDTAGQEKYNSVTTVQFRNAKVIIFVYDVSNRSSFERIAGYWLSRVDNYIDEAVPIFIVCNKMDLPKDQCLVARSEGSRLATSQGASGFFETSAKSGSQVPELFEEVARVALKTWSITKEDTLPQKLCEHCGCDQEFYLEMQRRGRKIDARDAELPPHSCCATGHRSCSKSKRSPFEPRCLPMSKLQ